MENQTVSPSDNPSVEQVSPDPVIEQTKSIIKSFQH